MENTTNCSYIDDFKLNDSLNNKVDGLSLQIGEFVSINAKYFGRVMFVGEIENKEGVWVGLELDKPIGKNSGSYKGKKYFECKPNHGIFIKYEKIKTQEDESNEDISHMLTTEEIINKYTNYVDYANERKKVNQSYLSNSNRDANKTILFTDTKENNFKDNKKTKTNNTIVNSDVEHMEIVNLVGSIYDAYKKKDFRDFDEKIEIFNKKMQQYGINTF